MPVYKTIVIDKYMFIARTVKKRTSTVTYDAYVFQVFPNLPIILAMAHQKYEFYFSTKKQLLHFWSVYFSVAKNNEDRDAFDNLLESIQKWGDGHKLKTEQMMQQLCNSL